MTTTPANNGSENRPRYRSGRMPEDAAGSRRVIRSDRIPSYDVEEFGRGNAGAQRPESGRGLRASDEAEHSVERRYARRQRRATQARRNRRMAFGVAGVVLLALVIGWRYAFHDGASGGLIPQRSSAQAMDMIRAAEPAPDPTPIFASRGTVVLRLPVMLDELTEVGFHQASYNYALAMKTPLPDADMTAAKKNQGTARDLSAQGISTDAVLTGSVLRMWRDRPGKPNTAVDVGAAPGTPVLAPVEGTVVLVKSYDLYGKHPDVRVHIRPDANSDIDVVLVHIQNPTVKAGDKVVAGVTRIGAIRKLSDKMRMQLTSYTEDDGDHVHIQLNDATDPEYEGLDGALTISGS